MLNLVLPLLFSLHSVPSALRDYLRSPDSSFSYKVEKKEGRTSTIEMNSQTWHGIRWTHEILYNEPQKLVKKGLAILFITGDGPFAGDYRDISLFTVATGMPVAMLFNEPNQPLYGMREDDLIAHTFEKYLSTGDKTWPLLFPMTKAAIRAMDAVVDATKGTDNPITHFVVTGASKRGWTTWLTAAAGDPRILGIAPMVYDNLNIGPQMKHQIEQWGAYSEMIQDYTRRGLQAKLQTPAGAELSRIVDPFSYRQDFHVPILVVKGANDQYWTADATSLYWNRLPSRRWLLTVPNVGHDLGGGFMAAQTVGAFARSIAGAFKMPRFEPDMKVEGVEIGKEGARLQSAAGAIAKALLSRPDRVKVEFRFDKPAGALLLKPWVALSDTTDFRKSTFAEPEIDERTPTFVRFHFASDQNAAVFLQGNFKSPDGRGFSLSTPTVVIKKIRP